MIKHILIALVFIAATCALWAVAAQAPPAATPVQPAQAAKGLLPSEVQRLRLQLKQKDAQLAQKDLYIAQQNFQAAIKLLNDEAAKVKQDNGWPAATGFNADTLQFAEGPKEGK